jgi:hypothetical protein
MGVSAAQAILFVDDAAASVDTARACGWRAMLYRGPEDSHSRWQTGLLKWMQARSKGAIALSSSAAAGGLQAVTGPPGLPVDIALI